MLVALASQEASQLYCNAEPSVETLMAKSCFQVLLQYQGNPVAAPVF